MFLLNKPNNHGTAWNGTKTIGYTTWLPNSFKYECNLLCLKVNGMDKLGISALVEYCSSQCFLHAHNVLTLTSHVRISLQTSAPPEHGTWWWYLPVTWGSNDHRGLHPKACSLNSQCTIIYLALFRPIPCFCSFSLISAAGRCDGILTWDQQQQQRYNINAYRVWSWAH